MTDLNQPDDRPPSEFSFVIQLVKTLPSCLQFPFRKQPAPRMTQRQRFHGKVKTLYRAIVDLT
jgi:hypothetical protein